MKKILLVLASGLLTAYSAYAAAFGVIARENGVIFDDECPCDMIRVPAIPVPTPATCAAAVHTAILEAENLDCVDWNVAVAGGSYTSGACRPFEGHPLVQEAIADARAQLPQTCWGFGVGTRPDNGADPKAMQDATAD